MWTTVDTLWQHRNSILHSATELRKSTSTSLVDAHIMQIFQKMDDFAIADQHYCNGGATDSIREAEKTMDIARSTLLFNNGCTEDWESAFGNVLFPLQRPTNVSHCICSDNNRAVIVALPRTTKLKQKTVTWKWHSKDLSSFPNALMLDRKRQVSA